MIKFEMILNILKKFILVCLIFSFNTSLADIASEIHNEIKDGNLEAAGKMIENALNENPKLNQNASFLLVEGIYEFETKNYSEAEKLLNEAKSKGNAIANLYLGRIAYLNYNFEKASEYYSALNKLNEKTKAPYTHEIEEAENKLELAENALERVQIITILDSINVPSDNFFEAIRLPSSAGSIISQVDLNKYGVKNPNNTGFYNEREDFLIWSTIGENDNPVLKSMEKYLDNTWSEVTPLTDVNNEEIIGEYPFLHADGTTLYFSMEGDDSLGGLDIYIAKKASTDDAYYQPTNLGMPFNSPFNDYLLVMDEENGIGWWATDRNQIENNVTIYVFETNEIRKNYNSDDENIISKASLRNFKEWQGIVENENYKKLNEVLTGIYPVSPNKDFEFPMGNGIVYTSISDFKNSSARKLIPQYLELKKSLEESELALEKIRKRYASSKSKAFEQQIKPLEKEVESQKEKLKKLKSDIYKAEKIK